MTRILLVRMSSLGDILHTFPAATDIRRARPDAALEWVVEEAYVPLVRMHPGVTRIIPIALRRWKRNIGYSSWKELLEFRRTLKTQAYDAIVDTQGLLKSAWVARTASGPVYGFGPRTARESLATRFYDKRYEFAPSDHKIERYRSVAAQALGFDTKSLPLEYGIVSPSKPAWAPAERYCVLLHATARAAKQWQESSWIELGRALEARGVRCVLPWGDEDERVRSQRLATSLREALVPPRMPLTEAAGLVGHAVAVIGVDTGLMHLAAALRVPVVGIFCDSEPLDAQPIGAGRTAYRGGIGQPPSAREVLAALREVEPTLR